MEYVEEDVGVVSGGNKVEVIEGATALGREDTMGGEEKGRGEEVNEVEGEKDGADWSGAEVVETAAACCWDVEGAWPQMFLMFPMMRSHSLSMSLV